MPDLFINNWPVRGGPTVLEGARNGCPICLARTEQLPIEGERVSLIWTSTGGAPEISLGEFYTVEKIEPRIWADGRPHPYLKLKPDSSTQEIVVIPKEHALYHREPFPEPPSWAPPLKYPSDWRWLDELVVYIFNLVRPEDWDRRSIPNFLYFITMFWRSRLPVSEEELWLVVHSHGAPTSAHKYFVDSVRFGRDLLIRAEGRKPIKSRRSQLAPQLVFGET